MSRPYSPRILTELRRFARARMTRLALVVAVCIPLLYGALYLWSFWDPTGHIDRLPVAVVNLDTGAQTDDGKRVTAGDDVADELLDSDTVDWQAASPQEAARGLEDGRYYATLTIPANFSTAVTTLGTDHPESAPLEVRYDDANGFTARTIVSSVMREVRTAVSDKIGHEAVDGLLVGFSDVHSGLVKASGGAHDLADGLDDARRGGDDAAQGSADLASGATKVADATTRAAHGAKKLDDGAAQLDTGSKKLADGASQAQAGAKKLAEGADQLQGGAHRLAKGAKKASKGADSLAAGLATMKKQTADLPQQTKDLADGAEKVAAGNRQIARAVDTAAAGIDEASNELRTLIDQLPPDDPRRPQMITALDELQKKAGQVDAQTTDLADGADRVAKGNRRLATASAKLAGGISDASDGADSLASGLTTISDGADRLATGADDLSTGADRLATANGQLSVGATTLHTGAHKLHGGTTELHDGLVQLSDATGKLAVGAGDLHTGLDKLAAGLRKLDDGAHRLADGLDDALAKVPNFSKSERQANADAMSHPVNLDTAFAHQAESNGEGLAPYFVGLSLYVGALVLWMLLRPLNTRALTAPVNSIRVAIGSYLPAWLLGALQVGMLMGVLVFGLGLHLAHPVAAIGFGLLVSAAFVAVQQTLNVWLGPAVGRVIVLILLMLQLTSAGGTYPAATSAGFFQVLHAVLPMSQVVNGFRESITGDLNASFTTAVIYLALLAVGSLLVTAAVAARQRVWTMTRLHPAVSL